jgi:hydrogenase nickel incorporation protein HypA/HybF
MHEILEIAWDTLRRAGGTKLLRLTVRVGEGSGVVGDALRFAFDALRPETPAADAELMIEVIPLRFACQDCQQEFSAESLLAMCPDCGSLRQEVRQGRELEVVSIEMV